MKFKVDRLARAADDVDLDDLTKSKRSGPAEWVDDGVLEIPFDSDPSPAEVAAIQLRLVSESPTEEGDRKAATAFLALTSPTVAQSAAQLQRLTRLVLGLLD